MGFNAANAIAEALEAAGFEVVQVERVEGPLRPPGSAESGGIKKPAGYLKRFGAELMDATPLFWTRGGRPISRNGATGQWGGDHGGGRHIAPRPYTKSSLNQDFRAVREFAFGKDEIRQLQDMRRSGAVEGDAGGATVEDQSNKMANTVDRNNQLRKAYNPVNVASVRRFDQARIIGAKKLKEAEQNGTESVILTSLMTLLKSRT
jgi:hypothetical protein